MANEKSQNTPEAINAVKGQILSTVSVELNERIKYFELKTASDASEKGSDEKKAYSGFLKARSERLGLKAPEKGGLNQQVHQFGVTGDGILKFTLSNEVAAALVTTLESGKIPAKTPSALESWLASKRDPEVIQNPGHIADIAALKDDGKKGGYVYVPKDAVLPEGVKVQKKNGEVELTKGSKEFPGGAAKIYVGAETARNAVRVSEGKPLAGELTATASLLRYNLDVISTKPAKEGEVALSPIEALKKIAESTTRAPKIVYVDAQKLAAAADKQKNVPAFAKAVGDALKEATGGLAARSIAVQAAIASADKAAEKAATEKSVPAKDSAGIGA